MKRPVASNHQSAVSEKASGRCANLRYIGISLFTRLWLMCDSCLSTKPIVRTEYNRYYFLAIHVKKKVGRCVWVRDGNG